MQSYRRLATKIAFAFLVTLSANRAAGQNGTLDPAFKPIDFDGWLAERHQAHLHLRGRVSRSELSFHQRLVSWVGVELDGWDLAKRRADGELMIFIQITDHAGIRYQTHGNLELRRANDSSKTRIFDYVQRAFFLPGDYRVAFALFITGTGEHVTRELSFHIEPQNDLPPGVWRDLPAVEFIPREKSPDNWYLPGIQSRLQWDAELPAPAALNIVLNVAPSMPPSGSRPTPSSGMAALLPTLKALSQIASSSLSVRIELLDLARRKAFFRQNDVRDLDWPGLKKSLGEATTASIDVHSLVERHHNGQFFVSEVDQLLRGSARPSVLVVLTTRVFFEPGEELEPISATGLPLCRVVYIRYHMTPGRRASTRRNQLTEEVADQLEPALESLHPRVFDVETPEEMAKAILEVKQTALSLAQDCLPASKITCNTFPAGLH